MELRPKRKRQTEIRMQGWFSSQLELFQLGLLQTLGLGPSVLEPDLHLGFCKSEGAGEFRSLRNGQVLLLPKLSFQGQELRGGERRTGFAVRLVLTERTGTYLVCSIKKKIKNYILQTLLHFLSILIQHFLSVNQLEKLHYIDVK